MNFSKCIPVFKTKKGYQILTIIFHSTILINRDAGISRFLMFSRICECFYVYVSFPDQIKNDRDLKFGTHTLP